MTRFASGLASPRKKLPPGPSREWQLPLKQPVAGSNPVGGSRVRFMRKDEKEKFDQAREWLVNGNEEQAEAALDWLTSWVMANTWDKHHPLEGTREG